MNQGALVPTILYQDTWIAAVDKPAGILVHGDGTGATNLTSVLQDALQGTGGVQDVCHIQALNRLDVDTTGLVLFSLRKDTQPAFDALIRGHECSKRYLVQVAGAFPAGRRTVTEPIGRDRHDARRMRVARAGKPSETVFLRLNQQANRALLQAELHTGRRHQIRVHLAWLGHPVVGDRLYGGPASKAGLMLHAWQLEFDHPITGEHLLLHTAWPERFGAQV